MHVDVWTVTRALHLAKTMGVQSYKIMGSGIGKRKQLCLGVRRRHNQAAEDGPLSECHSHHHGV